MGGGVVQGAASGSRRGRRRKNKAKPMSEINVTPFVDVMLVLLIIFMVAAPLLTVGVPVELPKTAASALPTEQEEPLTITVQADGQLSIMNTEVENSAFIGRLRAIAAERTSDKVFLRADGAVPYAQVVQIMGAMNNAGFSNIGLVTDTDGPSFDGQGG
ncbi:protein TolR [uncultured Litoreibacter sp.]|uniref:protein TolR n=1 Tax=uncultured Litoreibacter sp. TaxID=1392394 RepID=UPI00262F7D49|nr:protein TolR [uncultured Litoreibacter sp.]